MPPTPNESQLAFQPFSGLMVFFQCSGAGVNVDLGRASHGYRIPNGKCPAIGKYIELMQPSTNAEIWPKDYLQPVPLKNSERDTKPLGGGLAFPPLPNISPLSLEQLKSLAAYGSAEAKKDANNIKSEIGWCAWLSKFITVAGKNWYRFCICLGQKCKDLPSTLHEHAAPHRSWDALRRR